MLSCNPASEWDSYDDAVNSEREDVLDQFFALDDENGDFAVRQNFERRFRKPGPSRQAIRDLVNKFQRTGNVADEERSGRPATTPQTVQAIQDAITRRRKLLLSDVVRSSNASQNRGEAIIDESKQQNDMIMEATVEEETDTSSETEMAKSVVPTTDHLTLGELDQPQDTEIEQEPTTRQATTDECMETTSVPTTHKHSLPAEQRTMASVSRQMKEQMSCYELFLKALPDISGDRRKEYGFIPNALLTFKSKSTKDYHEEMDSTVFKNWFINQLLPNIPLNSIISALAKVTEDNWRKACEHVEKVEQFYWEKDGLVDEISDRFVINLDDTDTDEELSGGEESKRKRVPPLLTPGRWKECRPYRRHHK
ncbi:hypothetical protein ANN_06822 [Periplaneta americana]|uniref:DUF4817 domain-containing protein n=1 Tax=Periplaneta americana TaxID=6978 RepID=A0ABQ8TGF7_PERAM|nr:hypothetical protein ANN_06822 [Periplaneta americana]